MNRRISHVAPRPRVLMLIPQLGYGGAEGAFLRVAGFLARHVDLTIGLMARDYGAGSYTSEGSTTDLPVVLLDERQSTAPGFLGKLARWWRMLKQVKALKCRHDVAISFLSGANLLNAMAGPVRKTIVSERGSKQKDVDMLPMLRLLWTRIIDPWIYRRSRRVVAASEGLRTELVCSNPWALARIIALEGTLHSDELLKAADMDVDHKFESLKNFDTVVAVGRLHYQKGFDFLIRAFSNVRQERQDARLLIIGDGPELENLKELAEGLHLRVGREGDEETADIIFAGYRSMPLRYLRLGKVFVFPSRTEGLPNALMEALASGTCILSSDCHWGPRSVLSGVDDELSEGEITYPHRLAYGTLLPVPEHAEAVSIWSAEIARVLGEPRGRFSWAVRRTAVRRFDIEVTGPRWLDLVYASTSPESGTMTNLDDGLDRT